MPSLIISYASRSSPRIFIYHSSHIILVPFSFHSIILAFFTFPLIDFTMVLFAISSKLILHHFIYHTLLFIIPSSVPSYFTSISLITTHHCCSLSFASVLFIHSFPSIPIPFFLSPPSITLTLIHFHSITLIYSIASFPFICYFSFYSSLSHVQLWLHPSLSSLYSVLTHSYSHSYISYNLHPIHLISSLLITVSQLWVLFHVYRTLVIVLSFGVLIGNTLSQLDVTAAVSDDWFESCSIEWWGDGIIVTWGLEGIGVAEAVITEVDSIGW